MEFDEYQKAAKRTLYGNEQVLTNCALGLAGETGQVVDLVKNYTFRGKNLDRQELIHEMGDTCSGTCHRLPNGPTFPLTKWPKATSKR